MRELRLGDEIELKYKEYAIKGVVQKIEYDRIRALINKDDIEKAKNIKELDELQIYAHTRMGLKKMISSVIDEIDKFGIMCVENNKSADVVQKRKFVRVVKKFDLEIEKEGKITDCTALNISACGLAIRAKTNEFEINDDVKIYFKKEFFGKDIQVFGKIVKMNDLNYGIAYNNLNKYDEDLIMKFVFKEISSEEKNQE